MYENVFLLKIGEDHSLKKLKVLEVGTIPSPHSRPSTKTSEESSHCDERISGWMKRPYGDRVCHDLSARGLHTRFICTGSLPNMGEVGVRIAFHIRPPVGAILFLIFLRGYLLM